MPKRFVINIGGTQAVAELLEQDAPLLSQRMWESLPLESFSVHAKFAGREMIVMMPFYAGAENEVLNVQPGDIGYYPGRQTICIFYGDTQPFGYVSVFARIVERLDDLKATGDRVLRAGMLPAKLERLADSDMTEEDARLEPAFNERAPAEIENSTAHVLDELRAYIARSWQHEPADIATLRTISRPPMGNLPCCFYANFNLFWAGESMQVCRQQVKDGILPVQVVSTMLAGLLERHAARLEKWSMTETVALERMLAHYFKSKGAASNEEFLAVVEHAMIALDRVQSWIDGLLPWSELDARLALRRPNSVI